MSTFLQRFLGLFPKKYHWIFLVLFSAWVYYASFATHPLYGVVSTAWMNVYSIFPEEWPKSWQEIREFFWDLRTGIPPLFSFLEITAYKYTESVVWILKGFYRKAIIVMLLLPIFFSQRRVIDLSLLLLLATLFLEAIVLVHPANPQYYDVVFPSFIMLYLLLNRASWKGNYKPWIANALAITSGLFLTWAELSRPFMIALVPLLILWSLYHYIKAKKIRRFLYFLIPIILFSGLWHAKLLYRHNQLIWSNHSGQNFLQAWLHMVDFDELQKQFHPEEPPLQEGLWNNINTEVHYQNTEMRKSAAIEAITSNPGEAWKHFVYKTLVFTGPRTQMYAHDPQGPIIDIYKLVGRSLFILLGILMLESLVRVIRDPKQLASMRIAIIGITAFLSLMPIIGEDGEEARFAVSVLPFLMICAVYGAESIEELLAWIKKRRNKAGKSEGKDLESLPNTNQEIELDS